MPIQRIARYVLLLQDLKKNTNEKDENDYSLITLALDRMKYLANSVNDMKRKEEEMTKLFDVQKTVLGCPVSARF